MHNRTSPKAPLPIIAKGMKSAGQSFYLFCLIYSASLCSISFLICSYSIAGIFSESIIFCNCSQFSRWTVSSSFLREYFPVIFKIKCINKSLLSIYDLAASTFSLVAYENCSFLAVWCGPCWPSCWLPFCISDLKIYK